MACYSSKRSATALGGTSHCEFGALKSILSLSLSLSFLFYLFIACADGEQGQRTRDVIIPLPPDATGLGLTLQWCSLAASEDVWHILDVAANSPADHAGLLPYGDYIIGTPQGIVKGESGLGELVEDVCSPFLPRDDYPPMELLLKRSGGG